MTSNNSPTKLTKLILVGATGKLGKSISNNNYVTYGICSKDNPLLGKTIDDIQEPLISSLSEVNFEVANAPLVIDASYPENFDNVYDFCYKNKIPLISGSCIQWKGQLMKFDFQNDSACYECLFEDTSSEDLSCTESAIFSPIVGIIGSMLASESIKTITKISKNCQIFHDYDFKDNLSRKISFKKNNQCKICGKC